MTIAEAREKCKTLLARIPKDGAILAALVLASTASFALGYVAGQERAAGAGPLPELTPAASTGQYVGSRNGTKYYLPWCAGVSRISDANKVWFASEEEARAAGYAPASGCTGL